jgi:RNA polymerase sigma factor (sigma-70 family)
MTEKAEISSESFEKLLHWLDTDRERAGDKYQAIRARLIKIFINRGCHLAEELSDETIDRVAKKIEYLKETYRGDPSLYFYAVAKKVFLEFLRKPKAEDLPAGDIKQITNEANEIEHYYECLDSCLQKLSQDQRELILKYYQMEKSAKIDLRKSLAKQSQMKYEQLRVYVFRIRKDLRKCILSCVGKLSGETFR